MNARCLVCNSNDWEKIDHLIHKEQGCHICNKCGFVTYESILKKEEMKEHYRKSYRPAPSVLNDYTCERKLHFHNAFLTEVFKKWKDNGLENPTIFESGAAYGQVLNFIRNGFTKADLSGTELTLTMRRVCFHSYGIKLDEDFNDQKKYDLIVSYKVAEHVPDIDLEIRKYAECLNDGGYLYIGVPIWFKTMNNFGSSGWDIGSYYDTNHINIWTRKLFQEVLRKSGLRIIKSDFYMYDDSYLCKRDDSVMDLPAQYEDPKEIKERMEKILKANEYFVDRHFKHAFDLWPDFPSAYLNYYELNRNELHQRGQDEIQNLINKMFENCPESVDMYIQAANICMRYEQWDVAATHLDAGLKLKPNHPNILENLGQCFINLKRHGEARKIFNYLQSVSSQARPQARTWELHCMSEMPMEGE